MAMTLVDKLKESRRRHPFGQFGTADDGCTDNGALGCTHTIWRYIAFVYTGKWYSHDQLSRFSGYPCGGGSDNRGMRPSESQALCRRLKLPYKFKVGLTSSELLRYSRNGPIMFPIRYGDWPNWAHYDGQSRPRPWARPLDKAGRNQFSGFFGSHACALIGYRRMTTAKGKFIRNDCFVMEPNHDSPSRPQKVAFDIVTQTQLNAAYKAVIHKLGWSNVFAFVPTRAPRFPGGL